MNEERYFDGLRTMLARVSYLVAALEARPHTRSLAGGLRARRAALESCQAEESELAVRRAQLEAVWAEATSDPAPPREVTEARGTLLADWARFVARFEAERQALSVTERLLRIRLNTLGQ